MQTQERLKWFQLPQSLVKSHHLQSSCLEVAVTRMHSLNMINFIVRLYNYSCINELVSFLWCRSRFIILKIDTIFFNQPADSFLSDMMICHYLTIFHITGSIYSKKWSWKTVSELRTTTQSSLSIHNIFIGSCKALVDHYCFSVVICSKSEKESPVWNYSWVKMS